MATQGIAIDLNSYHVYDDDVLPFYVFLKFTSDLHHGRRHIPNHKHYLAKSLAIAITYNQGQKYV